MGLKKLSHFFFSVLWQREVQEDTKTSIKCYETRTGEQGPRSRAESIDRSAGSC